MDVSKDIETLRSGLDALMGFAVAYGFQIVGAVVFLAIGLKAAGWLGGKVQNLAAGKGIDPALSRLIGTLVRLIVLVMVIIITLGNFGVSIAPLIALAGAGAFGATMAIQGPLSNYGAGFSIILGRPFVVGNTITVRGYSGVVEDVALGATVLRGEDGERITIPNREIVGQVIVNSDRQRIVETTLAIDADQDAERAVAIVGEAIAAAGEVAKEPAPAVGILDFVPGGIVLGLRYWVPSRRYYPVRFEANRRVLAALRAGGVRLMAPAWQAARPAVPADRNGGRGVPDLAFGDGN